MIQSKTGLEINKTSKAYEVLIIRSFSSQFMIFLFTLKYQLKNCIY